MPMASRISCNRAIATVWYSVSSYRLMTYLLTPSLRASSVRDTRLEIRIGTKVLWALLSVSR